MTDMIPAWVNGKLTPVEKLEVHKLGLRHKAISVFIMCGSKVLLQRRALSKYHTPGLWANTCCTHPHWEETSADCAVRRLNEELGITGIQLDHRDQVQYRAAVGGGLTEDELVDIYVASVGKDLPMRLNPHEVAEVRWADLDNLSSAVAREPAKFTPWLRIYLEKYRQRIFGDPAIA